MGSFTLQQKIVWIFDDEHNHIPNLVLSAKSLAKSGYNVTVIDFSPDHFERSYEHLIVPAFFRKNILLFVWLVWNIIWIKPAIIVGTRPRPSFYAWVISIITRSRFVYYTFELYGEQHIPMPWIWRNLELLFLRYGVDGVITQNQERSNVLLHERKSRVTPVIIHNYKQSQDVSRSGKLRRKIGLSDDSTIILYEGYLKEGRWLDLLVKASAYLHPNEKLVLIGLKFPWWEKTIEPILNSPEYRSKVIVVSWIDHDNLLEYVADADVGIIIYDNEVRNNFFCEPGKLSDYVISRVPIVAPSFPTIQPRIMEYEIGITFDEATPIAIAEAIRSVLDRPRTEWLNNLEIARSTFIWETQELMLLESFNEIIFPKQ